MRADLEGFLEEVSAAGTPHHAVPPRCAWAEVAIKPGESVLDLISESSSDIESPQALI